MKPINTKLSICIPTYNRVIELEKNIINLMPICKLHNIEIVISDNNSSDSTEVIVKKYCDLYQNISYHKLESNHGIDFNINNVILNANSDYCWLLGDDDFIFESSLETILFFLEKFNPNFLLLNCEERNISNNRMLKPFFFDLEKEHEVISPNLLMSKYSGIMTLLSACVVKRSDWKRVKFEEYRFKYYFHMYNIFTNLNIDSTIVILNKPLFVRYAGNIWKFERSDFDDILHYYYPMTIESSVGSYTYKNQLSGIRMKIKKIKIGTFLRLRGKNLCSLSLFPKSYFVLMRHHLILAIIVLILPPRFSVFLYNFGQKLIRKSE